MDDDSHKILLTIDDETRKVLEDILKEMRHSKTWLSGIWVWLFLIVMVLLMEFIKL